MERILVRMWSIRRRRGWIDINRAMNDKLAIVVTSLHNINLILN
jgi:hypothetical protein